MRRYVLGLLLALAVALGLSSSPARAGGGLYPTVAFPTFTGSVNTETTIATSAAGTHFTIHSAIATIVTSGSGAFVVVFKDGTSGATIANVALAANVPTLIGQDVWGPVGYKTTASSGIITANSAGNMSALTILMRCDQQ